MHPPQRPAPQAATAGICLARMRASQQHAARRGRQPGDAGARGEEKDAQEVGFYKWGRQRNFEGLLSFKQSMVDFRERHLSPCGTPPDFQLGAMTSPKLVGPQEGAISDENDCSSASDHRQEPHQASPFNLCESCAQCLSH